MKEKAKKKFIELELDKKLSPELQNQIELFLCNTNLEESQQVHLISVFFNCFNEGLQIELKN